MFFIGRIQRHAAPFQVLHLVPNRGIGHALRMPFFVQAYLDDHALTATAATAKDAFAKAIEWHVVGRLIDISISDGTRNYSITEFSVMALAEIANTVEAYVNEKSRSRRNNCGRPPLTFENVLKRLR